MLAAGPEGPAIGPLTRHRRLASMDFDSIIFVVCMFFGVAAVALVAFTLLWIALGKLSV